MWLILVFEHARPQILYFAFTFPVCVPHLSLLLSATGVREEEGEKKEKAKMKRAALFVHSGHSFSSD